ncbi:unnamed protein product [Phytophthora fragariaefolia]|uniref:Unnamed protein product n=1 Tax=Phytophthora fragariaefolia TaxID=1490495 RepID=A0A9W7CTK7_9STRA|nr:unnamed protein product [Phytophthora fragariaefolia]
MKIDRFTLRQSDAIEHFARQQRTAWPPARDDGTCINTTIYIPNVCEDDRPNQDTSSSGKPGDKFFGSLGYAHIPDEMRRKLDAKAFRCRFLGYEDGVKGYRVLSVATGKVQIVRTVKFMETTSADAEHRKADTPQTKNSLDQFFAVQWVRPLRSSLTVAKFLAKKKALAVYHFPFIQHDPDLPQQSLRAPPQRCRYSSAPTNGIPRHVGVHKR